LGKPEATGLKSQRRTEGKASKRKKGKQEEGKSMVCEKEKRRGLLRIGRPASKQSEETTRMKQKQRTPQHPSGGNAWMRKEENVVMQIGIPI